MQGHGRTPLERSGALLEKMTPSELAHELIYENQPAEGSLGLFVYRMTNKAGKN